MDKIKQNPFIGLKQINYEEYPYTDPFDTLNKVEELAPSYQEGESRDLFLFLYFVNLLVKGKAEFLVKGGILLNYYLGEHARRTKDVDIYVKDPESFFAKVNEILNQTSHGLFFRTSWNKKSEAGRLFYHNTFSFTVNAYHDDELITTFQVDGTYGEVYDNLEKVTYEGPKIIDPDFAFHGISLERLATDKAIAATNDIARPFKHLVDLYGLIQLGLDIDKFKTSLYQELEEENVIRRKCGIDEIKSMPVISENKEFTDSYFLTIIGAGYNKPKEELIEEINAWFRKNGIVQD